MASQAIPLSTLPIGDPMGETYPPGQNDAVMRFLGSLGSGVKNWNAPTPASAPGGLLDAVGPFSAAVPGFFNDSPTQQQRDRESDAGAATRQKLKAWQDDMEQRAQQPKFDRAIINFLSTPRAQNGI